MIKKLFIISIMLFFIGGSPQALANTLPLDSVIYQQYNSTNSMGISVRHPATGEIAYSFNGNTPRIPASNLKLLTGAAALHILGPDYRYTTKMYTDGTLHANGVLDGNIYVQGTGDPSFLYADFVQFARDLKAVGIKHINGYVFADDARFSGAMFPPGAVPHEQHEYYSAASTAITMSPNTDYEVGTIQVTVKGTSPGHQPSFSGNPSYAGMTIINNAVTGKRGSRNTLSITRAAGSHKIVLSGSIPPGASTRKTITMYNPTVSSLVAFSDAIRAEGITFRDSYVVAYRSVPANAILRSTKNSMPLSEMYIHFMKKSINPMGDAFLKTMGYERFGVGDFAHGIKAVKEFGTSLGLNMDAWTIVDGSGLSAMNRVAPNELSLLLYKMQYQPTYPIFYRGLNAGGHPDKAVAGTLHNRFTSQFTRYHVVAKTGHITGVHALSGLAQGYYSGNLYMFSIMSNQSRGTIRNIDNVITEIVLRY